MRVKPFIIIPAYNEENTIGEVVKKAKKYGNVIVVDDGSKDSTFNAAASNNVIVLNHLVNLGKGAALRTGCDYAFNNKAEVMVVMDGDGQHDPKDIPKMINEINGADIVFSYRQKLYRMPFVKRLGNFIINSALSFLFRMKLNDTQCGFRAFKRNTYRRIRWVASDYAVESEIVAKTGKYKLRFKQLPIETVYSDAYKGVTVLDGVKIVLYMLWWKLTK